MLIDLVYPQVGWETLLGYPQVGWLLGIDLYMQLSLDELRTPLIDLENQNSNLPSKLHTGFVYRWQSRTGHPEWMLSQKQMGFVVGCLAE